MARFRSLVKWGMSNDIDLTALRAAIDQETRLTERVDPTAVARFRATFDLENSPAEANVVPPLFHFCLCQPVVSTSRLGQDGHPALGSVQPPDALPRRMWAGGEVTFHHPIGVGQSVTRTTKVTDVRLKKGRSGTLCFVTVHHSLESDDVLAITERQDIVYRANKSTLRDARPPAPEGERSRKILVTEPLLFRYSALTFNAHRIHYDAPYARDTEGYSGLVVHGPLQATLLCQFASDIGGRPPDVFSFRSLAPILGLGAISLRAEKRNDDALKLWTATAEGPIATEATAHWS